MCKNFAQKIGKMFFVSIAVLMVFLVSCSNSQLKTPQSRSSASLSNYHIVATLPVVSSIAEAIVNNTGIAVDSILTGFENPHTYDLKPNDAYLLENANLIVYVGHIDSWVDKFLNNKKSISINEFVNPIPGNPHVWFDYPGVIKFANNLSNYLSQEFPSKASIFQANFQKFKSRIAEIQSNFSFSKFGNVSVAEIYPTFDYLLRDIGIKNNTILALPGQEPTFNSIMSFIKYVNDNHVSCILSSRLVPQKLLNVISKNTKAEVVDLVPFVVKGNVSDIYTLYYCDELRIYSCLKNRK